MLLAAATTLALHRWLRDSEGIVAREMTWIAAVSQLVVVLVPIAVAVVTVLAVALLVVIVVLALGALLRDRR